MRKFKDIEINQGFKYNGIYYIKLSEDLAKESLSQRKVSFIGNEICNTY